MKNINIKLVFILCVFNCHNVLQLKYNMYSFTIHGRRHIMQRNNIYIKSENDGMDQLFCVQKTTLVA